MNYSYKEIPMTRAKLLEKHLMPSPSNVEAEAEINKGVQPIGFERQKRLDIISALAPADQAIYHSLASDEQKRIYLERQKVYGSCTHSHQQIGECWRAYLANAWGIQLPPLTAKHVAHMMVLFKIQRAAKVYHADNYVDAANYAQFAEAFDKNGQ